MTLPARLGKYRPLAELGRGGMATVYLCAHTGPGDFEKLVVVKELKPELAQELEFRDMFLDEARLAARLSHPNIVQTYEVTGEGKQHFIVMEYLDGQPFSNVRARLGKDNLLTLPDHARVIADLLEGLHAAHETADWNGAPLHVVHRDVSPHNVFITYAGAVKVVDFGIAKAATSSRQTATGVIKGKLSYMAPEQALGKKGIDRRADIFAVGIMLWEAVAVRRMWKDMPDAGILHHLSTGEIPMLRDFVLEPDPMLEHACARALAPRPEDRYATAAEMRADLEEFLAKQSPRPSAAKFGELVASAFAEEREELKRVIEDHMTGAPKDALTRATSIAAESTASGKSAHNAAVSLPPPRRNNSALYVAGGAMALFLLAGAGILAFRGPPRENLAPPPPPPQTTVIVLAPPSVSAQPTISASAAPSAKPVIKAPAASHSSKPPDIMLER